MPDRHSSSLSRYLGIARRRFPILLATTVIVPLVALGVSLTQVEEFRATSSVLLSRQSIANLLSGTSDPSTYQPTFQQIRATQAQLARTAPVARQALAGAGISHGSVGRFLAQSDVTTSSDDDLLTFSYVDRDGRVAMRLARAYANAFVAHRGKLDTASLDVALREVARALAATTDRGAQNTQLRNSLASKQQQLQTFRALQTSNAQVVDSSEKATKVQPRPVRNVALGLMVGLLLAIGLALLRDMLDSRVRSADEIAETLHVPALARITKPRIGTDGVPQLAMRDAPTGPEAESFRILRMSLRFMTLDDETRVIMVSSASQAEGKSTTIANLALAMARAGDRVVLVDLDLRRPTLAKLFHLDTSRGLTDVVLGKTKLEEATTSVPLELPSGTVPSAAHSATNSLAVLPTGMLPPDPAEFINSRQLATLFMTLRERFDVILVDAPPLIHVSDTVILTSVVDALYLCTRVGSLRRPALRELRRILHISHVRVLGHVLTGAEADEHHGYQYGYRYGQSNGYRQQETPVEALR